MVEILALLLLATVPHVALPASPAVSAACAFLPVERAVGNWRAQAALDLDLDAETALRWLGGAVPANLPRCIRLNNYWCIKKAGWAGEIGADPEGHAAFASAELGAVAAIVLLRRYYLDYGRKSARAIVMHWAPAQCELSLPVRARNRRQRRTLWARSQSSASAKRCGHAGLRHTDAAVPRPPEGAHGAVS